MNWQFSVCTSEDGVITEVPDTLTPVVNVGSFQEAVFHPDIVAFCKENGYRIYKIVGR